MMRFFSFFFFFSFIGVRMVGEEGGLGEAVAGVAVRGRLVVGWPVGGEGGGLGSEKVFLLFFFFIYLFIYF